MYAHLHTDPRGECYVVLPWPLPCVPHLCALRLLTHLQAPPISLGLIHRCVLDLEEPDVGRHMAEVLAAARAEVGHHRWRRVWAVGEGVPGLIKAGGLSGHARA